MSPTRQRLFARICRAQKNLIRVDRRKAWRRKCHWLRIRNRLLAKFKHIP